MRDPDTAREPSPGEPPLRTWPGLEDIARILGDAVTVTDLDRRVVLWNRATADLYGIPEADALGVPVDSLYDSEIVGLETTAAGARALALELGSWRGRVADRPRIGTRRGQEIILDVVLDRLDGSDETPIGVVSIKRDITASAHLERELSNLGSLVTATGEARSRTTLAERALTAIADTTGAQYGAIVLAHGEAGRLIASRNFPSALQSVVDRPWSEAPAVRAVAAVGSVVKGSVDRLPLAALSRTTFLDSGIRTMLAVGLHREEELVGVLSLGWATEGIPLPSDSMMLLVATTIARGLENARLVEEIVWRADNERATAVRLRKLDGLTRIGSHVQTPDELAVASSRLINDALEGNGTAYGILAADGLSYSTSISVGCHPDLERWLAEHGPDRRDLFRLWRTGEGAYLESFDSSTSDEGLQMVAQQVGLQGCAMIPIRIDTEVHGRIAVFFERPIEELHLDRSALEQVATIASISLQNFRLRDQLVRSERRYRAMFEESPDPILVVLPEGAIIDANEASLRLFRGPREWLIGRRPEELVIVDPRDPGRAARLGIGSTFSSRAIGIRRDGTQFPHEDVVTAIDIAGERRLMVRIRDLTEQERLQAELIQAQKMEATGQLVSGVAHELNNPLAAILGFSQLIRRDPDLPEELRHNADLLVEEATRTRGIVQNLLDFARQRPPERHPTPIRALVESVLALQSYSLGRGGIEVELDIPDDLPRVELDRGQIQQVLVNLTHNAIYAIKDGGGERVSIRARAVGSGDDARVEVTVMDDGPGVADQHVDRLFEAFFTTKPPADGTGLGLPVSVGIVESHGGELRYAPAPWGRGAAFTFDLPVRATGELGDRLDPPAQTTHPPEVDGAPAGSSPRVLVLDDEPSIRTFLERGLRALGYAPVVAVIGDEAIDLATTAEIDLILCDHQMATMSGIDVWDTITTARPDLARQFVLMSGDVLNPVLEAFAAANHVAVLGKPFDLETLDRTLREVLAADQSRG